MCAEHDDDDDDITWNELTTDMNELEAFEKKILRPPPQFISIGLKKKWAELMA